jgi:hypothetical protein
MTIYAKEILNKFYVIHFRAYDQYSKTEPAYAQYCCLFIVFSSLSPQHVSAITMPFSRGLLQIT